MESIETTNFFFLIENLIDGKCPVIQKKELLDINDIKLLSLASRIESIYKAICKSTDQFKPSNLPELTSNSRISRSSRNEVKLKIEPLICFDYVMLFNNKKRECLL